MTSSGKASAKLADSQTLTASYVDTAAIGDFLISEESVATIDVAYTTGAAETNNTMELRLLFSHDGVSWTAETYASLSSGVNTLAPMEHRIAGASAATAYTAQLVVPFCSRHLKVQVKESGVAANYGTATVILTVAAASGQERNVAATNVTISGGATEAKQDDQITQETIIAGDTTSIDGKITACNTGAVVLAAGTAEIGKLAAGVAEIGNVKNSGTFAVQPGTALTGPGNPVVDSYTTVAINLTTGADQVLVSSAASKQIWVYGYALTCGDADGQTVSLQDEDNTALTGIMEFSRYGGISVPPSGNFSMPIFKCATDKDLEIDIQNGDVDGWISYAIVSV